MKNSGEKQAWAFPGTAQIFLVPVLSQEQEKLRISNLASIFRGPSEQNPIKNFGEKGVWAYPGTAQFFQAPPIISGTGKATYFKFGQYIQRVHPNKSPLKSLEKKERGRWAYTGTAQIFWSTRYYPRDGYRYEFQILYARS